MAVQAQIELGFEKFLVEKDYQAIVTHFGDLGSLKQLPGLAIQRLMEKGYGFGGEGDWKTAAMVRLMKIMTAGMEGAKGTSFMEDYTYNLVPGKEGILQAHMLEVCPSIADSRIAIRYAPPSMGDRGGSGPSGIYRKGRKRYGHIAGGLRQPVPPHHQYRELQKVEKPMPKLPVATAFWTRNRT